MKYRIFNQANFLKLICIFYIKKNKLSNLFIVIYIYFIIIVYYKVYLKNNVILLI